MSTTSAHYTEQVDLIPVNFSDETEFAELLAQRRSCGWKDEPKWLRYWQALGQQGLKTVFWIVLPSRDGVRAGHISLDSGSFGGANVPAEVPTASSVGADRSVMTIATFFTMPEYRSLGLGRRAMDVVEEMATEEPYGSPRCKAIEVDTLAAKFCQEETYRQAWSDLGLEPPDGPRPNVEEWYVRRGYVKWKEEPKYLDFVQGKDVTLPASFLRKHLQQPH